MKIIEYKDIYILLFLFLVSIKRYSILLGSIFTSDFILDFFVLLLSIIKGINNKSLDIAIYKINITT